MRIAYCTNVRLPTERAHGHQIAAVCEALRCLGHTVHVYAPYRRNHITTDFSTYYQLSQKIPVSYGIHLDPIESWWAPGVLGLWCLNSFMRRFLRRVLHRDRTDLVYTRSPALLGVLLRTSIPVVLELHSIPRRMHRLFVCQCNACSLIICLTNPMREALIQMGVDTSRILVEGDAVNLATFDALRSKKTWSVQRPCILYTGQLSSMGLTKGIPELLDAMRLLKSSHVEAHLTLAGGPAHAIRHYQSLYPDLSELVTYLDHVPHDEIPSLLSTADIVVYPAPSSDHPFYQRDTSPMKIFEYMASQRPMIVADLPPLRDILSSTSAMIIPPGDPPALAQAIIDTLANPGSASLRAQCARECVVQHTWIERMRRILLQIS